MPNEKTNSPLKQAQPFPPRPVDLIVIHCSATPSGKPMRTAVESAAEVINRWHKARSFARRPADVKAFNSGLPNIGYHYVIDLDGRVHNGRALHEVGAHAQFFNARSVGICLVGGIERNAQYTAAQWTSLVQVVATLCAQFGIPAAPPKRAKSDHNPTGYSVSSGVCGHRDVSPDTNKDGTIEAFEWLKTCPGFDVAAWMKNGMKPTPDQICEVKP